MRAPLRNWVTLLIFLLVLAALVASGSDVLDQWTMRLVWSAFLIGSIVLIVKNVRQPSESQGFFFGQTAWLPPSWRHWILGEKEPSKIAGSRSADNPGPHRR